MKRQPIRPTPERQAPFFVGIDVGKRTHYVAPFMVQLTVSATPLAMVGWRYQPES